MQTMIRIRQVYDDYLTETARLGKEFRPGNSMLGFGKGTDSDPCHDLFTKRVEQALNDMAAVNPATGDVKEVLSYIYEIPEGYKNDKLAYWMMLAVHSLTERLAAFLSQKDAAALALRYAELYPKSARLPAQRKIAQLLQAQGGISPDRRKNIFAEALSKIRGRS